jgi:hypothetical protein
MNNCKRCNVSMESAHIFFVDNESMWICHACWLQWEIFEQMYEHAKKLFIERNA